MMPDKMVDPGDKATNDLYKRYLKEVVEIYAKAAREIEIKSERFVKKLIEEDKAAKTEDEKKRVRQISTWLKNIDVLAEDLLKADKKAVGLARGYMLDAYAENFNFGTYDIERNAGISTAFTLYDRATVENLIKNQPDLLPIPEVDEAKDYDWAKQKMTSAVTRGILQGDSIAGVTERIMSVTTMGMNAAVRTARTAMTSAQNAGRIESWKRAENLGVKVKKQWLATLDYRTRSTHRHLDGETVGMDEKFSNGLRFPGDPNGSGTEVYNCRCTMIPVIEDVSYENVKRASKMKKTSYEDWKKGVNHG